jgi:hypothetical protein
VSSRGRDVRGLDRAIAAVPMTTALTALLALSVAPEQIEDDDEHGHAH